MVYICLLLNGRMYLICYLLFLGGGVGGGGGRANNIQQTYMLGKYF